MIASVRVEEVITLEEQAEFAIAPFAGVGEVRVEHGVGLGRCFEISLEAVLGEGVADFGSEFPWAMAILETVANADRGETGDGGRELRSSTFSLLSVTRTSWGS